MASSSGHVRSIHGYGMSMALPAGWHGSIGHGYLIARGDGLTLRIDEWQDTPQDREGFFYFRMRAPVHMRARNFGPRAAAPRFRLHGRYFVIFANGRPTARALRHLNAALVSFGARRGDFYGGTLPPARFAARPRWHVATSRAGRLLAQGGQTETAAATFPLGQHPFDVPPYRVTRLPADGIVIVLTLSRSYPPWIGGRSHGSFHIDPRHVSTSFEGMPSTVSMYQAFTKSAAYDRSLYVFFGRPHPTRAQVARAQAELDSVRYPAWPKK